MSYAPELTAAPKTSRYEIIEVLGRGATSIVYKAFDVEKNFIVALKHLKFPEYDDIYSIKQEFRFFRDFHHTNLVSLYDLYAEDDLCFYTMEFIDGRDFVSFVRSPGDSAFLQAGGVDRIATFRLCLSQLVDGLTVLHAQGRLHRDLKPTNVLVERNLRTVLLDFGLSTEARPTDSVITQAKLYAGTPAYMAPEQLAGELASEASDLYSLGVIVYEALTGRRPYPDGPLIAHYEAQKKSPVCPRALSPEVPADLNDLALALLSFDPRDRPRLRELKQTTGASATESPWHISGPHPRSLRQQFVGRDTELARLENALVRAVAGNPVAVRVSGVSGVGKTTLLEKFLTDVHERRGALVLRSRCHHQESVRYNAVDGLIDTVSRYLVLQSEEHLADIAPKDLPALITMFPVLGRVPFPYEDFDRDTVGADPHLIVRQGIGALRGLFHRIAARRPIILWIDDLQWSDKNSLPLLCEIAVMGGGKPILPIFSYRTEDLHSDSVAVALEQAMDANPELQTEHISVPPLEISAVNALVQSLVVEGIQMDPAWVRAVAQESAGLPFFVVELVAYSRQRSRVRQAGDGASAASILEQRLRSLPASQRALLEVVSVAGTPVPEDMLVRIAARAAASGREIYQLLHQNLLRKGEMNGRHAVETFHDRIRAAVLASLDSSTRRLRHKEIADEIAGEPNPDHRLLVEHYFGAGELALAAENAVQAGRHSVRRLAFENAVEFFSLAWRLCEPGKEDWEVGLELASALADAGRSAEAAELFLDAARWHAASGSDRLRIGSCEARAAQQYLYSGRLASGLDVYRKLFSRLRIPFPSTLRAARRMSVRNRLFFALGLRRLRVRHVGEIPAEEVMRIDMLWAAAKGFLMLDYVVGDAMFSWYMREAAALGERSRVLRALALEAAVLANIGRDWSIKRSNTLLRRGQSLAAQSTDPYDRVVLLTCQSSISWCRGHWREAAELAREAVDLHRRECVRYDFMIPVALGYRVSAMVMSGLISQAKAEVLEAIEDAQQRGDIYVSRLFKSGYWVYVALAEDDPDTVIAESDVLLEQVGSDRFTSLHWSHFNAKVNALVYAGKVWDAWSLVQQQWPLIAAVGFLKFGCIGAHLREIRARASLNAAAAGAPPKSLEMWTRNRLLRIAEEDARSIAQNGALSHGAATAAAIRSGIATMEGEPVLCRMQLEIAREGFERAGMSLHQAAVELRLGRLATGSAAENPSAGQHTMTAKGIKRPDQMSKFLTFS